MVFRNLAAITLLLASFLTQAAVITAPLGAPCSEFFSYQNAVYTCIEHPTAGNELHKINGGRTDTELVADINSGAGDSNPRGFFLANGSLYFFAQDRANGESLWRTNGTAASTQRVRSISSDFGFRPTELVARVGNTQYFLGTATSGQTQSTALFRTDGSSNGTAQTNAPIVDDADSNIAATTFTEFGGSLYFVSLSTLYKLGAGDQVEQIFDDLKFLPDSGPQTVITDLIFDDQMVIQAADEIWLSDGTTAGTEKIIGDATVSAISPSVVDGKLIYGNFADDTLNAFDGTNSLVLANFESNAPITRFGLSNNGSRAVYSQTLISQPKVIFTGGTTATTRSANASTRRGLIEFAGSFYGSDDNRNSSFTGPHSIIRANPTNGSAFVAVGALKQLQLIQPAQQGVFYQACIDRCDPGRVNDRIGLSLLRSNGVRTLLATIGTFGAGSTVTQSHVEGSRSYYTVRDGANPDSPFRGIWHSNGTTGGTYRLEFQFDDGVEPPAPEKPKVVTGALLLLLLDDDE